MTTPVLPMFVINLESRPERLAAFRTVFDPLGLTIEHFAGIRAADGRGVTGCRESHLAIIRLAKARRYPWVAIFEDDCIPYSHFREEFPKVLRDLWTSRSKWDVYNGGPIYARNLMRLHHNIVQFHEGACTQFMIVNASAYDKLLAWDATKDPEAVDMYYRTFRQVTSAPVLTYQSNTPSDIQEGYTIGETDAFVQSSRFINCFWIRDR